jgi:hypothetical protein
MTLTRLRRVLPALALAALLTPATAQAFSFGPFNPGEYIDSLQLVTPTGSTGVEFTTVDDKLVIDAFVSEIVTNQRIINITLGDLVWTSAVTLVGGTESVTEPFPTFFGGAIAADFVNGIAADVTLFDGGPGGAGILLDAEYVGALQLNSTPTFGLPVSAQLGGDFDLLGTSDPTFAAAFGSSGNYFANLSSMLSNGTAVGSDLCVLIEGGCNGSGLIDNFTVNPGATVQRTTVPEPGAALLYALGLTGLACFGRKRS